MFSSFNRTLFSLCFLLCTSLIQAQHSPNALNTISAPNNGGPLTPATVDSILEEARNNPDELPLDESQLSQAPADLKSDEDQTLFSPPNEEIEQGNLEEEAYNKVLDPGLPLHDSSDNADTSFDD